MLSNAYFLAKFRFDTAENEPAKNLQNFREMHFRKMHFSKALADYLLYLDRNVTAYLEYVAWRDTHTFMPKHVATMIMECNVCRALHERQSFDRCKPSARVRPDHGLYACDIRDDFKGCDIPDGFRCTGTNRRVHQWWTEQCQDRPKFASKR